jgi:2-octaprenyl-6-methoxyphenol hydroxylase
MINKIHKYNFLIMGGGLIGSLAGLHLKKKGYKVLVVDKNLKPSNDQRTLAVNANSKDFLISLGVWNKLKSKPQKINKIIIKDTINESPLMFEHKKEEMGNVIFNNELLLIAKNLLKASRSIIEVSNLEINQLHENKTIQLKNKKYSFNHIILSIGKKFNDNGIIKKYSLPNSHRAYVGFFNHSINHYQTAYESFTKRGPLAVLPSPNSRKNSSTFIYSTSDNLSDSAIYNLLKKNFTATHGVIKINKKVSQFSIFPHISKDLSDKYFLIGDTLRSIHPVAGQGWNLGIKDIQILSLLLESQKISDKSLVKQYSQMRLLESTGYLSFTSLINFLYENQNPLSNLIIKTVFNSLKNFNFLREGFINQAMGRLKLI